MSGTTEIRTGTQAFSPSLCPPDGAECTDFTLASDSAPAHSLGVAEFVILGVTIGVILSFAVFASHLESFLRHFTRLERETDETPREQDTPP